MFQASSSWQTALANCITDPRHLLELLELDMTLLPAAQRAATLFPLRVTQSFLQRIKKNDIHDPLLRQILPLDCELKESAGFSTDPLAEKNANPIPGLLHKYHGRVLLTLTGACAINCRYCFRRTFPYQDNNPGTTGWEKALTYIANDPTINEVIFSGGDPLVAPDKLLATFSQKIAAIPHVKTLRIHSRLPIVLPERITENFITWFTGTRLNPILVIHCNHPQEINTEVALALQTLRDAKIVLLNQAVLLKNINDNAETLIQLSETLFNQGVLPYYLHLLDRVQGTAHFEAEETIAKQLMIDIRKKLPGYLVPKLVREVAGESAKSPITIN